MRIADAAGVGTLAIFHHDPSHDDAFMDGVAREAAIAAARHRGERPAARARRPRRPDAHSVSNPMSASSSLRGRWRRLALGLPTVLGLTPRGWFIPHRYAPLLPPPGAQPPYPAIERLFEEHADQFAAVLDAVDARAEALEELQGLFEQSWFPSLDAAVAYALVRERKPRHIIEVGSGHSTRILSKAVGGVGEILAIDPAPRADIVDLPGVRVMSSTLQAAPAKVFDGLGAGRRAVHRFQPHPDAGQRRRHPVQPRPAAPAVRRAGPYPRHLPAVRLSGDLGLARLQRAAGRGAAADAAAPSGRCSPASGRSGA